MQMPKAVSKNSSTRQRGADDQVDGADDVVDDHQVQHRQRQHEADRPGEALLRRAHVFGLLLAHQPLPEDQAGRVARVDEDADREVDQEGDHEHPRRLEVADQPGVHERDDGEEEHDAGGGAHGALVQHPHGVDRRSVRQSQACRSSVSPHQVLRLRLQHGLVDMSRPTPAGATAWRPPGLHRRVAPTQPCNTAIQIAWLMREGSRPLSECGRR